VGGEVERGSTERQGLFAIEKQLVQDEETATRQTSGFGQRTGNGGKRWKGEKGRTDACWLYNFKN